MTLGLYLLVAVAGGFVGQRIGYYYGVKDGYLRGAEETDEFVQHLAPDFYPEIVQRMLEHDENPNAFHSKYGQEE